MELNTQLEFGDTYENGQTQTSILVLPDELILHIMKFLKFRDILKLTPCLNKKFYDLSKDPMLIPKSFTLHLFRSSNHEKNIQCREQMTDIIARASLLKTLSIEVNHNCNLNEELQFISNDRCKGLKTLALLGYNQSPSDNRIYLNDMPKISEETTSALVNNWQKLSTIVLHNYVCGDGGQSATNFISSLPNLKRFNLMHCVDYDPDHLVTIARSCRRIEKFSIDFNPTDRVLKEILEATQETLTDLTIADMEPSLNLENRNISPLTDESFKHLSGCTYLKGILFWNRHEGPNFSFSSRGMEAVTSLPLLEKMEINAFHLQEHDYMRLAKCKRLTELSLSNALHLASRGVTEILKLENIRVLALIRANSLRGSDFARIIASKSLANLTDLTFWDCLTLEGEEFSSFFETNNDIACKPTKTLELRYCKHLNDLAVGIIMQICNQLKTLDLGGCRNLTDACMEEIVKHGKSKLQTLIISTGNLSDECVQMLKDNIKVVKLHDIA